MIGAHASIDPAKPGESLDQETGANQQDQGERDFGHDECVADPTFPLDPAGAFNGQQRAPLFLRPRRRRFKHPLERHVRLHHQVRLDQVITHGDRHHAALRSHRGHGGAERLGIVRRAVALGAVHPGVHCRRG